MEPIRAIHNPHNIVLHVVVAVVPGIVLPAPHAQQHGSGAGAIAHHTATREMFSFRVRRRGSVCRSAELQQHCVRVRRTTVCQLVGAAKRLNNTSSG